MTKTGSSIGTKTKQWHFGNFRKHFVSKSHCEKVIATIDTTATVEDAVKQASTEHVYKHQLTSAIQNDVIVQMCKSGMSHTCMELSLDCTARALRAVAGPEPISVSKIMALRKMGFKKISGTLTRLNAVTTIVKSGNQYSTSKRMACRLHRTSMPSRIKKLAKVRFKVYVCRAMNHFSFAFSSSTRSDGHQIIYGFPAWL